MSDKSYAEIKEFIKNNLVIEAEYANKLSPSNDIEVTLRFLDDKEAFASSTIIIPDNL